MATWSLAQMPIFDSYRPRLPAYGERPDRHEFDAVIFALDDEFRAMWAEKNKPKELGK